MQNDMLNREGRTHALDYSEEQPAEEGVNRQAFLTNSVGILDAMANANRLAVLTQLATTETSVGDLSKIIGISQSALSQHLSKLRMAGLVTTRRQAQLVYYSCNSLAVLNILQMLSDLFPQ